MPLFDMIVLSTIVAVFATFGVVLGFLTWYCSDKRKRPIDRAGHRHYDFPRDADIIVDD